MKVIKDVIPTEQKIYGVCRKGFEAKGASVSKCCFGAGILFFDTTGIGFTVKAFNGSKYYEGEAAHEEFRTIHTFTRSTDMRGIYVSLDSDYRFKNDIRRIDSLDPESIKKAVSDLLRAYKKYLNDNIEQALLEL